MSDAVAIVAVVSSGVVGLAGILTGVWGARAARRWQGHEERVAELRAVLDTAAGHLGDAMQAIAEANEAVRTASSEPERTHEYLDRARVYLDDAMIAQKGVWSTSNRLRVRRGSDSPVAQALMDAERELGHLGAVVSRRLVTYAIPGYDEAWAKAQKAEQAFYNAAAADLTVLRKLP
jgi:hypothetical protein